MIDYQELAKNAGSVGLLVDRCIFNELPIGTVFMVDHETVATCAHLVILYKDFLRGLKVVFPASGQSREISSATFHPRFNTATALQMAQNALSEPVAALALQDHNVVLLKLTTTSSELKRDEATAFNRRLSSAPMPRVKGLSGSVEEIGLALVIQTVNNARKDGVLYICDERNRPLSRMFFRDGKIRHAKFGNLVNEAAIYQMFQVPMSGQFHLQVQSEPDFEVTTAMERGVESLLLEAHRRMDEVPKLLEQLGGTEAYFARTGAVLNKEVLPPEGSKLAEQVWTHLDGGISLDALTDVIKLDNYSIYAAIVELLWTKQAESRSLPSPAAPATPLEMAAYEPLSPWDEIVDLTVHPKHGRAQLRTGQLVGLLRPNDPYHLLHTLSLPYSCAGSPLLKNGKVVGMHCGMLPLDPALHALPRHLYQMIWVDSVQTCLTVEKPQKKSAVKQRPSIGMARTALPTDTKLCPKCQSVMVKLAVFCGTCGNKL